MSPLREASSQGKRIAVLCLGNPLAGDDGVGIRVGEWLIEHYLFPEGVDVIDAGVMGMALLPHFADHDLVLTVDAVEGTGTSPGTVLRFQPDDVATYQGGAGAHDMRFSDVLQAAVLLGHQVQGTCVGVQVASLEPGGPLAPEVEAAVPLAGETAVAILVREWGVEGIRPREAG